MTFAHFEIRKHWYSIYGQFEWWSYSIGPASYFDNRAHVSLTVSPIIGLLTLLIFGFNWISIALIAIPYGHIYIDLPIYSKINECEYPRYGFYFYNPDGVGHGKFPFLWESFWITYGYKSKCFYMPWSMDWVRTSILLSDGKSWEHDISKKRNLSDKNDKFYGEKWQKMKWRESYLFTYVLKNGTVQNRMADVTVEEREWRWRWFTWLPYPRMIQKTIAIQFDGEVGERTGSWKGGTIGCGWPLKSGQTPLEALRDMEKNRKFS